MGYLNKWGKQAETVAGNFWGHSKLVHFSTKWFFWTCLELDLCRLFWNCVLSVFWLFGSEDKQFSARCSNR